MKGRKTLDNLTNSSIIESETIVILRDAVMPNTVNKRGDIYDQIV